MRWVRVIPILVVLLAVIAVSAQTTNDDQLIQAAIAYENGDYNTAIVVYERAIESGIVSAEIHYNLSASYFAAGFYGRSLLNAKMAQALAPRDADISNLIEQIRVAREDVQGDEVTLIDRIASLTIGLATVRQLSRGVFLFWLLGCALFSLLILRREWQEVLRAAFLVVAMMFLLSLSVLGSRLYAQSNRPRAIVVQRTAPMYSGADTSYLLMFELHDGAEVRIVDDTNGWLRLKLPDGRSGWAQIETVQQID